MPLRNAQKFDTVVYRYGNGKSQNGFVLNTIPSTPAAPGLSTSGSGGTLAAATYSYRITKVVNGLESLASPAATQVTVGTTSTVTVTLPGVAGEIYKVYGRTAGTELLMHTSAAAATQFIDTGAVTPAGAIPTATDKVQIKLFSSKQIVTGVSKGYLTVGTYELR
ncbi:MAG: hypothetical protein ABW007_27535 [Chitinophagaceae bacterium]